MAKKTNPSEDRKVSCSICRKEIPLSEAISAEAVDYVAYFCGLDCYNEWKNKSEKADSKSSAAKKR